MDPLTSFAISYAAGIALDVWKKSNKTVEKEIKKAYNAALIDWCPNAKIRNIESERLKSEFYKIIEDPIKLTDGSTCFGMFQKFYIFFAKRIAEYQTAYNYVESVKNIERYNQEIKLLDSIQSTTGEIREDVKEILAFVKNGETPSVSPKKITKSNIPLLKVIFNRYSLDSEEYYLNREIDKKLIKILEYGNVWLFGFSGIGKTAMINRNLIQNKLEYVFCDCSPRDITSADIVIDEIIYSICEKYSLEIKRTDNCIKDACSLLKKVDKREITIVIDELSISTTKLLTEITSKLVMLITHYCNKSSCLCLRFIVSTIKAPIINTQTQGKAIEHFEFIEIDEWGDCLYDLLILIDSKLDLQLTEPMKSIIIGYSMNSPRVLKKIIRKIYSVKEKNEENIEELAQKVNKEQF